MTFLCSRVVKSRIRACKLLLPLLGALYSSQSNAVLTVVIEEQGGDVVMIASGTINTAGLGGLSSGSCNSGINTFTGLAVAGDPGGVACDFYTIPSPTPSPRPGFGGLLNSVQLPDTGVGIAGTAGTANSPTVTVPAGYVSGAPLSASSVFSAKSLGVIELTPGIYTVSWGSGANADSVVVEIRAPSAATPTAVPTLPLFGLLFMSSLLGLLGLRKLARA